MLQSSGVYGAGERSREIIITLRTPQLLLPQLLLCTIHGKERKSTPSPVVCLGVLAEHVSCAPGRVRVWSLCPGGGWKAPLHDRRRRGRGGEGQVAGTAGRGRRERSATKGTFCSAFLVLSFIFWGAPPPDKSFVRVMCLALILWYAPAGCVVFRSVLVRIRRRLARLSRFAVPKLPRAGHKS